jgi:hypothetical protein
MNTRAVRSGLCVIVMLLLSSGIVHADVTGKILGTVTDPSGAAVSGAEVMLRNLNTGLVRSTKTDAVGSFLFLSVPVGDGFRVEVSAPGFEVTVHSGIKLLVNQSYRADIQLTMGAVAQTVTVSSNPVQVETSNTQIGDVIEDKKMTSLPLNGRSFIDLLGLQVGVVPLPSDQAVSGPTFPVSGNNFEGTLSVNGNRESGNGYIVNGGDVNESTENGASVVPTLDSIQEFRLLTGAFDAEYGRFSGGLVNVITKSGSNTVHGNLYEFLRNEKLDAHNYFDVPGTPIGEFRRNQFGGTLGGPIRKNRLFFFSDYQGTREVRGTSTGVIHVPSDLERTGDFSDVGITGYSPLNGVVHGCPTSGGHCMNDILTQRLGYTVTNGEPYWVGGCNTLADAQAGTCVFPGQIIPQSAWSPAAAGTLGFIPTPTGSLSGTPFFSTSAFKNVIRDDKFGARIDLNERTGSWSIYYHFDDASILNPYPAFANVPGFASTTPTRAQQVNLSNTRNFGATTVNDWRLNFTRFAMRFTSPDRPPEKVSDFGFVEGGLGLNPTFPAGEGVPDISFAGLGLGFGVPGPQLQFNNTYQASENLTKIVGKHTLKFGADARYFQLSVDVVCCANGLFFFFGNETGNDFADYLLGAPGAFIQYSTSRLYPRSKYFGAYGQDSYKVNSDLTINYGLRWEFSQPWYDAHNRLTAFVPGSQSKRFPDAPRGYVFAGDPGIPRTLAPTRYDNFAPRVGIAYSPGVTHGLAAKLFGGPHMTSIRASFGIFYSAYEQNPNAVENGNTPFGLFWSTPSPVYLEEPFEGRQGVDPGQRFPFVPPPEGVSDLAAWANFQPLLGQSGFQTNNAFPYVEDMMFSVQRQLGRSTILTAEFVGTHGHHLLTLFDVNPGNPQTCLQIRQILGPANGCGPYGEDTIYALPGGQNIYGTRPYSVTSGRLLNHNPPLLDFGNFGLFSTSADSHYNALEVTLDKRVGPMRMLAAYTWSKSLDDASSSVDAGNPYNIHLQGLSAFDSTHDFVMSYNYDLPFKNLTHSTSGIIYKLLEGWQASGITRFATGLPVHLVDNFDQALCGDGCGEPDYSGQPLQFFNPRVSANHEYFSTSQFSLPALGSFGTARRRFFHGPGLNNWDFALQKVTHVTEGTSVEVRAEFFNVFNHAQFKNPVGDFASSAFGQVIAARDPRIGQLALKFSF